MTYSTKLAEIKAKADSDFYFFCKHVLGYSDMAIQPHKELCEFMESWEKDSKLILLPRGSFKSTVATVCFSLYTLCKDPNERIMIATENYQNSVLYLREIKDHIENNEMLKKLYGDMKPKNTNSGDWTRTEITVATKTRVGGKEPSCQVCSLGTTKVGLHFTTLILDDLVSNNNTATKEQMDKVIDWYKYLLSIADPGSRLVSIGTRYHYGDLYAYIQENEPENFDILIRGAYNEDGSLYFPSRLTADFLEKQKKRQGSWIFSCQYMNQAIDTENQCFREEWIEYYDKVPQTLNYFITIDPAGTTGRESDYTAVLVIGVDCYSNIYVIENYQLKVTQGEWMDIVFREARKYEISSCHNPVLTGRTWESKGGAVSLETNALQKTYKYAFDLEMEKRKEYFPIVEAKPTGSSGNKESRIAALQPFFEQGKVFLKRDQTSLIDQILRFPKSKNDDQIDALKDVLPIMYPPEPDKEKTKLEKATNLTQNERDEWKFFENYTKKRRSVLRTKLRRI
jgi:predicted phage terminase large subunit-like protein